MIHIATVHWQTARWIDLQLAALERFVPEPYRTYAFLNGIPSDYRARFSFSSQEPIDSHAVKLNILGDVACCNAAGDDDVLLFIDGDAFPIAPLAPLLRSQLRDFKLIAVQQYEVDSDPHPHPSFCLTTVGLWKQIEGNWHKGATWIGPDGKERSDVGGDLLAILAAHDVQWLPLRRLNRVNPHPVFFGVYGHAGAPVVYHHGAGFRSHPGLMAKIVAQRQARATAFGKVFNSLPDRRPFRRLKRRLDPFFRIDREMHDAKERLSQEWFERISRDEEAWRELL